VIPYGRQNISQEDIDSVIEVLKSDYLTQGKVVPEFEQAVARKVSANYAVAVNSATSALHLACLSLGLQKGDYCWTVPNTFVASANCALYCGAEIDFVDIDPVTYNMSITELTKKLYKASENNTLPKIIIPVAFSGLSCDMKEIYELSKKYGFKIIEDASHAIGGKYQGGMIGNCKYSDITIFSFHPVKIITSGEGGMALTNNAALADKMRSLRSHGITRNSKDMINKADGDWYYEQVSLGYNYRMSDIHASLGFSQLNRLEDFIKYRHKVVKYYSELLQDFPLILPKEASGSSWHLYVVKVDKENTKITRKELFNKLGKSGVGVNVHYIPVHTQPFFMEKGFRWGDYPIAEEYYENSLSLPIFYSLSKREQQNIAGFLQNIFF